MNRLVVIVLACLCALPSFAATIRVERDGSADFSVIQDAVNAAASGDTIYIGPGRYNEGEIVSTPGWTEFVRVLVQQEELTFIGSGPDATILGPLTPYDGLQGDHVGIIAGTWFGCNYISVEGIGFENMYGGLICSAAPETVFVKNCRFEANRNGVLCSNGGIIEIESCVFNYATEGGRQLNCGYAERISVRNCNFELDDSSSGSIASIQIESILTADIRDCLFSEGNFGLILGGGNANVSGCSFSGQSTNGLGVRGCDLSMDNCIFEQQETAIYVQYRSTKLRATNCAIMDVNNLSLKIGSVGLVEMSDCILAHGPEYTVLQYWFCEKATNVELTPLIMTNNDWGTDDAETIASWIHVCDYEVEYIPFIGQPVATESIEFGGLKAMFR